MTRVRYLKHQMSLHMLSAFVFLGKQKSKIWKLCGNKTKEIKMCN